MGWFRRVVFCGLAFYPKLILPRFLQDGACINSLFFCIADWCAIAWVHDNLFIHSIDGHFHYFTNSQNSFGLLGIKPL